MAELDALGAPTGARVLVVDDDHGTRKLVREVLTSDKHEVLTAADAHGALEWLERTEVELVLTDLRMPGGSGTQLLAEVRERYPGLPVVVMSGDAHADVCCECMRHGAVDFLPKPLEIARLRRLVADTVAGGARVRSSADRLLKQQTAATMIGRYRVVRPLGRGTQGIVLLVEDGSDPTRRYAAKVFGQQMTNRERARFENEAKVARLVCHDNVVKLVDGGVIEETGAPYLIYEYVAGQTLRFLLRKQLSLGYAHKARILRQLASALEALHQIPVVHRDLKPENVLLDGDFTVKLADLGVVLTPGSRVTQTDVMVGAPAYVSPEMANGRQPQATCDLFALGIVAYELFTGDHPFQAFAATPLEMMVAIAERDAVSPRVQDPNFPEALDRLLADLLAKKCEDRLQTASAAVARLDAYLATATNP